MEPNDAAVLSVATANGNEIPKETITEHRPEEDNNNDNNDNNNNNNEARVTEHERMMQRDRMDPVIIDAMMQQPSKEEEPRESAKETIAENGAEFGTESGASNATQRKAEKENHISAGANCVTRMPVPETSVYFVRSPRLAKKSNVDAVTGATEDDTEKDGDRFRLDMEVPNQDAKMSTKVNPVMAGAYSSSATQDKYVKKSDMMGDVRGDQQNVNDGNQGQNHDFSNEDEALAARLQSLTHPADGRASANLDEKGNPIVPLTTFTRNQARAASRSTAPGAVSVERQRRRQSLENLRRSETESQTLTASARTAGMDGLIEAELVNNTGNDENAIRSQIMREAVEAEVLTDGIEGITVRASKRARRRMLCVGIPILLVVIAVILVIVFFTGIGGRRSTDESSKNNNTEIIVVETTLAPTVSSAPSLSRTATPSMSLVPSSAPSFHIPDFSECGLVDGVAIYSQMAIDTYLSAFRDTLFFMYDEMPSFPRTLDDCDQELLSLWYVATLRARNLTDGMSIKDMYAAGTVFLNFGGPRLTQSWDDYPPCGWPELTCTNDGIVLGILATNLGMNGEIPTELGILTSLCKYRQQSNGFVMDIAGMVSPIGLHGCCFYGCACACPGPFCLSSLSFGFVDSPARNVQSLYPVPCADQPTANHRSHKS